MLKFLFKLKFLRFVEAPVGVSYTINKKNKENILEVYQVTNDYEFSFQPNYYQYVKVKQFQDVDFVKK